MSGQVGKLAGALSHAVHETQGPGAGSPLPLEAASLRLRKPAGRPRKHPAGDSLGDSPTRGQRQRPTIAEILGDRARAPLALAPPERPGITARRLYSRRQAAEYLSCSVDTVDRLVRARLLPKLHLPHSRLVRFDLTDLERIVAAAKAAL